MCNDAAVVEEELVFCGGANDVLEPSTPLQELVIDAELNPNQAGS